MKQITQQPVYKTREEWLSEAVRQLIPVVESHATKFPEQWAISCGFPKRGFKNNPSIGECWDPSVSPEGVTNMFISPILSDPLGIVATTLHEMVHAAVGLKAKHSGEFRRVARALGLKGKLTATFAEAGTPLYQQLYEIITNVLGQYPGKPMAPRPAEKKAGWFLVKLHSVNDPTYKFTIAPRLIEEFGMPKDHLGDDMVVS